MGALYPEAFLNGAGGGADNYNFSYNIITQTIIIRFNQQMIVAQELIINEGEELRIEGQLVLIP